MRWNYQDIKFLYPPDVFMGSFDNEKMQTRHEQMKRQKTEALLQAVEREQDPLDALMRLDKNDRIRFLLNNRDAFVATSRFEAATLRLYRATNSPFIAGGDFAVWKDLFRVCDRKLLAALGTPVTFAAATVYRISITGGEQSLSWTADREIIKGFEQRWYEQKIGNGRIFALDVTRANVLIYLTDRNEGEVILDPAFLESAPAIREVPPLAVLPSGLAQQKRN